MMEHESFDYNDDIEFTFHINEEAFRAYQDELAKALGLNSNEIRFEPQKVTPPDDNGPKVFEHEMVTDLEFKMMMGDI